MTPVAPLSPARAVLHVVLVVFGMAFGVWALYRLASVLLVLTLAALFAYVIAPLVHVAERPVRIAGRRRHLPRGVAIAVVYLGLVGAAAAGALLLLPSVSEQAHEMFARAPSYGQSVVAWEHGWSRYYERLRIPSGLRQSIDQSMVAASEAAVGSTRAALVSVVGAVLPWLRVDPDSRVLPAQGCRGIPPHHTHHAAWRSGRSRFSRFSGYWKTSSCTRA